MVAAFSVFGFGISRFLIDFLRADPPEYRLFSQGVSLSLAVIAGAFLLWQWKQLATKK